MRLEDSRVRSLLRVGGKDMVVFFGREEEELGACSDSCDGSIDILSWRLSEREGDEGRGEGGTELCCTGLRSRGDVG